MAELREGLIIKDRFELRSYLGGGGFGDVWCGYDGQLEREVAIKRLLSSSIYDPGKREEVVTEARKIAAISDPHIVAVFDVLDHEDELLIVMEYLPGGTLQDYLRSLSQQDKWVEIPEAFVLTREILSGLNAAHACERGCIIHRDLKPLNILFDRSRRAKLADFGLAAFGVVDEINTAHPGKWEHEGTFGYKSPEQLKGAQIDHRSDLFNAGLIAYLLFAAAHPFTDPRFLFDYKEMVLEPYRVLPRIEAEVLPDDLQQFLATLLALDPNDRFQSASESLAELEQVEERYNSTLLDPTLQFHDDLKAGAPISFSLTDHELARGISLCKRNAFYLQGAFLYDKSGTDFSTLNADMRSTLDDDCRVCRRRASREVSPQ